MVDPIPEGFRLLHVGPGKTGTTALQSAFHHNRAALLAHGVSYAGAGRQPWSAANQAVGLSPHVKPRPRDRWDHLLKQIEGATARRVVISSEGFAPADEVAAAAIVDALGRDRTHVVITLRPPADLLSSNWWQSVAGGGRLSYLDWLELVLSEEGRKNAFWVRTRFDTIAERWAQAVGPANVTAISLAGQPRDFVLRTFEQLTDLPTGTLVPGQGESNASLSHPVAETVRQFYEVRRQQGLRKNRNVDVVRGAALNLLRRNPDLLTGTEPIVTPAWAVEAASVVAREMNGHLDALGINIVGDLEQLVKSADSAPQVVPTPTTIPIADAAALVHAMVRSSRLHEDAAVKQARARAWANASRQAPPPPEDLGGRELVKLLGRRVKRKITRR